jgi:hypothetical protein
MGTFMTSKIPYYVEDIIEYIPQCPYTNDDWRELERMHYYDVFYHEDARANGMFMYLHNIQFLGSYPYRDPSGVFLEFRGSEEGQVWRFPLGEFTLLIRPG